MLVLLLVMCTCIARHFTHWSLHARNSGTSSWRAVQPRRSSHVSNVAAPASQQAQPGQR